MSDNKHDKNDSVICVHAADPHDLDSACDECADKALLSAMRFKQWKIREGYRKESASWPPVEAGQALCQAERQRREQVQAEIDKWSTVLGDYTPPANPPQLKAAVIADPPVEAKCGPAWCDSPAEHALMLALGVRGLSFEQQHQIGGHFVDFAFPEQMLVLEVDGFEFHDRTPEQAERDKRRDRELMLQGWRVARFSGREAIGRSNQCATEVIALLAVATEELPRP